VQVFKGKHGGLIKAWIDGVAIEDQAREQLDNMAGMPFIHRHVAVMPDCHWGMGATVGSVIPSLHAIIPAAVGVDIGCGMMAIRTGLVASDLPDNLLGLRTAIESRVPHGRTDNGGDNDQGAWNDVPDKVSALFTDMLHTLYPIVERHPKLSQAALKAPRHAGTLGTGNHFIEVCLDEEQRVWVMLHSGSRGIGNRIGSYFIELAKQDMRKYFINLPDDNLAYSLRELNTSGSI
jgi:tRNA-splicing ligase RtcB